MAKRKKREINPGLAAMLLIGVMLAVIVVGGNQLTGAQVAQSPANANVCNEACQNGYGTCIGAGGGMDACRAALTVCQNSCTNPAN